MAIFTRHPLSGSTNGKPMTIIDTDPGTTIHTVSTATALRDQVYLWAMNNSTSAYRELTLLWGGTGTRDYIFVQVPNRDGLFNIVPGLTLVGATDIVVRAYGTSTSNLTILGYVDRAS